MKEITDTLKNQLADYQADNGYTLAQLGSQLGKSEAYLSSYLSGKAEGDTASFERRVADMLRNAARRRSWNEEFFKTKAVEVCDMVFDLIRESGDIGLIHGPAGIGKTTACRHYAAAHATTIGFTATEGNGRVRGVVSGLSAGLDMRRWDASKLRRQDYVRQRLSGSSRLVIIDNAQRLTMSGLRWLFDFQDETGCPIALVGNADILERLRGNDQLTSRIGFKQDIGQMVTDPRWLSDAADAMVAAMWPSAAGEIRQLARDSAQSLGHLRTLNKQLRIAIRLAEAKAYSGQAAKAFATARHLIGADQEE